MSHIGLSLKSVNGAPPDIHFESGELVMVRDAEAVGQHVRQRLMAHAGEWYLDRTCGVPWLSDLLGKAPDVTLAEALTKAEIIATGGVTEITSFSVRFDRTTRGIVSHDIAVRTIYGEGARI